MACSDKRVGVLPGDEEYVDFFKIAILKNSSKILREDMRTLMILS